MNNQLVFPDELTLIDGTPIYPRVFYSKIPLENIPDGFDAVSIYCNGRTDATLDWKEQKRLAQSYVEKGLRIFWELDLGLFSHLRAPLLNQTQFYSLGLSLQHFQETLWSDFREHTLGLSLYKGSISLLESWKWSEEQIKAFQEWLQEHFREITTISSCQEATPELFKTDTEGRKLLQLFCRNAAVEYVEMLSDHLPADLAVCMLLETDEISDKLLLARLLSKDRFERVSRVFFNDHVQTKLYSEEAVIGICLPQMSYLNSKSFQEIENAVKILEKQKKPFRFIYEPYLTSDWQGLDYLLVVPEILTPTSQRKLKGFCAAGGTVITDFTNLFVNVPKT